MKTKYKPIIWGKMESSEMSEAEIMRVVPTEIIQYYVLHYKTKGVPLNLRIVMEIRDVLRKESEGVAQ